MVLQFYSQQSFLFLSYSEDFANKSKQCLIYFYIILQTTNPKHYIKTRMKTLISSEALSQSGAEKITFLPKPDGQTVRHTDGWTDIRTDFIYRVASLLKRDGEKQ